MPDAAYCNAKNDIEASVNPQEGSHPPAGFAGDFAIKAFVRIGCKLPSISLMRRAFTPFLRNIESSVVVPKPIIMPATPKSGPTHQSVSIVPDSPTKKNPIGPENTLINCSDSGL